MKEHGCILQGETHSPSSGMCSSLGGTAGLYLEVLLDSLLIEALGQDHHPPLQLVAQGDLAWVSTVFLGNFLQDWILQEMWAVLLHPEKRKYAQTVV